MCRCTPTIKTPWCGKPGCEIPPQVTNKDYGHFDLIFDLECLLAEARVYAFHDFKSDKALPKVYLGTKLQELRRKMTQGEYDNKATYPHDSHSSGVL